MRVQVAYVGPGIEALVTLDVAPGATVDAAVALSGIVDQVELPRANLAYAIFGRRVDPATRLVEGDRVEITRPLVCDPKLARRRRAAQKG